MGAPLSFDMPETRKLAAEMPGKWQKLRKKRGKDRAGWRDKVKEKSLDHIMYVWILQKCQRQKKMLTQDEWWGDGGSWGVGKHKTEIFLLLCHWSIGGEVENYPGSLAISHPESRPDTAASIIHMTTVNEQDPNKSPLNSLVENWNIWLPHIWHRHSCF